jgi:hypothetical protein
MWIQKTNTIHDAVHAAALCKVHYEKCLITWHSIPFDSIRFHYIRMNTLFTREFPGTGWRGQSELAGGLDFCNFARRTEIVDEPTPAPGV